MGCDIHMGYQKISKQQHRENKLSEVFDNEATKISEDWEWIDDAPKDVYGTQFCDEDRNYNWFGRMSEVRGDGPRITEEGFPDGVSIHESGNGWDLGDHSHSHIYLDKLLDVEWNADDRANFGWFMDDDIPKMLDYCHKNDLKPSEFRILMGYDS